MTDLKYPRKDAAEPALDESTISRNAGKLISLGRKQKGIAPDVIAKALGISLEQFPVLEKGQYRLSFDQWMRGCEFLGLNPESVRAGHLDRLTSVRLRTVDAIGDFEIPKRYQHLQGSAVRAFLPFISYLKKVLGEEQFNSFLYFKKIDPDYFLDLCHQLNFNFVLDLLNDLSRYCGINETNLDEITRGILDPELHGFLAHDYLFAPDGATRLRQLLLHIDKYEIEREYHVENIDKSSIDVAVKPGAHLKEFDYKAEPVGKMLCSYKRNYLRHLTLMEHGRGGSVSELDCHFNGADRCVYRIAI